MDKLSKLITDYQTTPANVHDSQVCGVLVSPGEAVYDDSAYADQPLPRGCEHRSIRRASRNQALTESQKGVNKILSKTRVRVAHSFAFIENSMKDSRLRSIGFRRAVTHVDLTNLTYNLFRFKQIQRLKLA